MSLLGNAVFLIFGGGAIIAIIAILADTYNKAQKRKQTLVEREYERAAAFEDRLLGADDRPVIEGISLRLEALEADMREIKTLLMAQADRPVTITGPRAKQSASEEAQQAAEMFELQ